MPFEPTHSPIQPFLRPLIFLLSTVGCFVIWSGHPYITTLIEPVLKPEVAIIFVCYFFWKLLLRHSGFLKNPTVVLTRGWPVETMWSALMHQCFTLFVWFMALRESRQSEMPLFDWFSTSFKTNNWDERFWDRMCLGCQLAEMYTDFIMYGSYEGFDLGFWGHHLLTFVAVALVFCMNLPVGESVFFACTLECGSIALNYNSLWPSRNGFRARVILYTLSRGLCTLVVCWSCFCSLTMSTFPLRIVDHLPLTLIIVLNWYWCLAMIRSQLKIESDSREQKNV